MTLKSNEHTHKTRNSWSVVFFARLASFSQSGLINVFINLKTSWNGLDDHKRPTKKYFVGH